MPSAPDVLVVAVGSAPEPGPLRRHARTTLLAHDDPALPDALAHADGLVVWDGCSPAVERAWDLAAERTGGLPRLRWVHTSSAGPDRLLFPGMLPHPCALTCSRGVLDRDIAEYVLACVLALLKDLTTTVRLQDAHRWRHRGTLGLAGRSALVVGAGSLGTAVGEVFAALGVAVDGVVRSPRPASGPFRRLVGPGALADVVGGYDLLLVTAPLSPATRGLVSADVVARTKPGAVVVNVGRGPVVDQDALLAALRSGHLRGVALDVWDVEPLPAESPWWDAPGAIVSPHLAGDAAGFEQRLEAVLHEQLARFATDRPLLHVVDKLVGYATPTVIR